MHKYFNPGKINRFIDKTLPVFVVLAIGFLGLGLYFALFNSPADYQQGEAVRIMYVHVPSAWMALLVYCFMAAMSAASIIWRSPIATTIAVCAAPVGTAFAFICLVTGAIWGKPIWGAWWVWDARLTSMLVLFLFYLGYIALYNSFENEERAGKMVAILAIVGVINIPIIKFSVEWWNTLHQPSSILRSGGVAIDGAMLRPLMLMFGAYLSFFVVILFLRIKTSFIDKKLSRNMGV